jgi:predicted DNA binding protein
MSTLKDQLDLVEACEDYAHRFNDWESDFIDSVKSRLLDFDRPLTDRQMEILEEIYERVTS